MEVDPRKRALQKYAAKVVAKLNAEIERGNLIGPFAIMFSLAILKDVLDASEDAIVAFMQWIIGFGQAMGLAIEITYSSISFLISATLFLFMLQKGFFLKTKAKMIRFIVLSVLDVIPFIGSFPLQTFSIYLAYRNVKKRSEAALRAKKKLKLLSERELKAIDMDIATIDTKYDH